VGLMVIIITHSTHVETIVLLSHKKADTYINVNVGFGEGEGKIPIAKIAEKRRNTGQAKESPIK